MRSFSTILRAGTEGTDVQHTTGFACDVCDGSADVDVGDGDHYLCAAHALEPMMEIDLTRPDSVVTVSDAPAPNVIMMGTSGPAPAASIGDADIRKLLADVVVGLRSIQYRLESLEIS